MHAAILSLLLCKLWGHVLRRDYFPVFLNLGTGWRRRSAVSRSLFSRSCLETQPAVPTDWQAGWTFRNLLPFPGIKLRVVEKLGAFETWKLTKSFDVTNRKTWLKINSLFVIGKRNASMKLRQLICKFGERPAVSRDWNFIGFLSTHNYFSLITWMSRILACKWTLLDSPSLNIVQSQGLVVAYRTTECQKWNVCLC